MNYDLIVKLQKNMNKTLKMQCVEIEHTLKTLQLETVKLHYNSSSTLQCLWRTLQVFWYFKLKNHAFRWDCLLKGVCEAVEVTNK